jgi:hypothetical protein
MKRLTAIVTMVMAAAGSRASVDFSRYAPILERRVFSSPVVAEPVAPPPAVTVEAPPVFVQHLRMVAITESPAGVRAGFVNIREKPPKTYFLYVGDSSDDGILLAEADYDRERALLRKEGEQYWLEMGKAQTPPESAPESSSPPPPPTPGGGSSHSPRGVMRSRIPVRSTAQQDGSTSTMSYAERRQKRIEEMRRRAEESRNLSEKEVEKRLSEYKLKLIREGKTPLPIPLTEEEDAQLVKEGILPPAE